MDPSTSPARSAAAIPTATISVVPTWPTAKATTSRRLRHSNSASASNATRPGSQIWMYSDWVMNALSMRVVKLPSARLCRLVLAC